MNEGGNKMNPMMLVGVIVMIAIIGGVVMISGQKGSPESATPTPEVMEAKPSGTMKAVTDTPGTDMEVKTINIDAGSFYYDPKVIKVKKGEKVKIVMTSKDMMHDFNIDELGVKLPITKAGETSEVEFTADTIGTFEYYCSIGQHRKNGQVGTIIVE
ncbi:MAG: cupredoxin domain-containing protein [bacterium]|nr:cupredoxin domain-containing protein [bacterium]